MKECMGTGKMRVAVTGATGQLGRDVTEELRTRGHEVLALGSADMDITKESSVREVLGTFRPDAVIHCAAWTAVDAAEDPENREKVFAVNAEGTANIAAACREFGCKMLYISTDYVFSGEGTEPWDPDCRDFRPLNVYGESKLAGEKAVCEQLKKFFIVRIAWVFGLHGKNFVRTMLNVAEKHDTVRVVNDQIGTPTYTADLAELLADMIITDRYGFYHATNEGGYISWYNFTCEIYRQAGKFTKVLPVTTAEYGLSRAKRPFNSRLEKSKLTESGFKRLPDWKDALSRFLKQLAEQHEQ